MNGGQREGASNCQLFKAELLVLDPLELVACCCGATFWLAIDCVSLIADNTDVSSSLSCAQKRKMVLLHIHYFEPCLSPICL